MKPCPFCSNELLEDTHSIVNCVAYPDCADVVWECLAAKSRFTRRVVGREAEDLRRRFAGENAGEQEYLKREDG